MSDDARPDVVAVVGSPRRRGNTVTLVDAALEELRERGLSCEKLLLCDYEIGFCLGHDECGELAECPVKDDAAVVVAKAYAARGLILASPVYSDNVSAQMKVFMDRCCHSFTHEIRLAASVVGLLSVAESTGLDDTIDCMRRFLAAQFRPGAQECTMTGYAYKMHDAERDEDLLRAAARLGARMADLLGPPTPQPSSREHQQ
jgi:multimeric flavodoxin WrbA